MITFTIPGKPHGKERPRVSRGRVYTPPKTAAHEKMVAQIAKPYFPQPIEGPIKLTILATFETPKSWSKKKTKEHLWRHHTQTPDLSNLIKQIEDSLNGIAYEDDKQVAEYGPCRKVWGDTAQVVVIVEEI